MATNAENRMEVSPVKTPFNIPGISPINDPRITSISSSQLSSYSQKPDSVAVQTIKDFNGDYILTPIREFVYALLIDAVGGLRQVATAVAAAAALAGGFIVAGAAEVFIPFGLLFTGVLTLDTALAWTIPDAIDDFKDASKELELVRMKDGHPLDLEEAKKNRVIAGLGLGNQSLYGLMGFGQIAAGFITIISSPFTHIFNQLFYRLFHFLHWSYKPIFPLLTGAAATTAAIATIVALAAIYVVRGIVMMTRAAKKLIDVSDFRNKFHTIFHDENYKVNLNSAAVNKAISVMKEAENDGSYLKRRVDATCLQVEEENGNKVIYTAEGIKRKNGIEKYDDNDISDKIKYLSLVDKGIYSEKLKNQIAIIIAGAMIIGGILAIIMATAFTGGIAPLVIGLISAVFFISMEYIFLTYDSSYLFKKLRDRLYNDELGLSKIEPNYGHLVVHEGDSSNENQNSDWVPQVWSDEGAQSS